MKTYEDILAEEVLDKYNRSIEWFFNGGDWLGKKEVLISSAKLYASQFIDSAIELSHDFVVDTEDLIKIKGQLK